MTQAPEAPQAPTLMDMREDVYLTNVANGWFTEDRPFLDDVALIHSEISEIFEAYRDNGFADATVVPVVDPEKLHELSGGVVAKAVKPEGFGSEAADVLVRILDTAHRYYIEPDGGLDDIPGTIIGMLSVGGHIAELHRLTAQLTESHLGSKLDRLTSYLVSWCRSLDIDLQAEFDRKLAYNKTRGFRHGGKLV